MRATCFLLFVSLAACSAVLDWDRDNLPCATTTPRCDDGFSCLGDVCVRDGSTGRDGRCTEDRQCEQELSCRAFVCRASCGQAFYAETGECPGDEYCAPFEESEGVFEGFCVASECRVDSDCVDGSLVRTCVPIKVGAGACLSACEFGFDPTYFDNCVVEGSSGGGAYCQPLGRQDPNFGARLVCLDSGNSREGEACNPVVNPCQEGFTCDLAASAVVCAQLCSQDDPNACSSGQVCCGKQYGQAFYSVCAATCD